MINMLLANYGAIINVVALVFMFGFALLGLSKGFVKTLISTFGTIFSLLFAVLLCSTVSDVLENKFSLVSSLSEKISNVLLNLLGEEVMETPLSLANDSTFGVAGIGGFLLSIVHSIRTDASLPPTATLNDVLAPTFSYYVVIAISIVITFILFKIALFLIGEIVKRHLYEVNIIRRTDRTLGFFLGLISGVVYLEFIILIISILPFGFFQNLYVQIHASTVGGIIESINLYSKLTSTISIGNVISHIKALI